MGEDTSRIWHFWWAAAAVFLGISLDSGSQIAGQEVGSNLTISPEFTPEDIAFFESQVRPLLINRCHECHSGSTVQGGLRLDSRSAILRGGDSGQAVVPYQPGDSLVIAAVRYEGDYEMPPDSKLPRSDVKILEEWVRRGVPWTAEEVEEASRALTEFDLDGRKAAHWCWHPIERPVVPESAKAWQRDAIDAFVWHEMDRRGLQPAETADRLTLVRRLYFDLIGLPPPSEVLHRIASTADEEWMTEIVDELLASPHFGERWGRHWLDLVRYAETSGHEFDYPIADAHAYRDYVIRALNIDVPYDQFLTEHLAGDLMESPRGNPVDGTNESILATGFWFLGEAVHAPVDIRADQATRIDNQLDVACKTFLGLTVACARCHDHKFDAISTADYYALTGYLLSSHRQRAMLDPGGAIAEAHESIDSIRAETNAAFVDWARAVGNGDQLKFADYLSATIQFLNQHPRPTYQETLSVSGESLTVKRLPGGSVQKMAIGPQSNTVWEGDQHLLWIDAAPGQELILEFSVPETGEFDVSLDLTRGVDFGIVEIGIDEVGELRHFDGYSPRLELARNIHLGSFVLTGGVHELRLRVAGRNPQANARFMLGIDRCVLTATSIRQSRNEWLQRLAEYADERTLRVDWLERLTQAVLDGPALADPRHPLHGVQFQALHGALPLLTRSDQRQATPDGGLGIDRTAPTAMLFEDFSADRSGWRFTGWAIDAECIGRARIAADGTLIPPHVISSREFGEQFQGIAFSPTFVISHPYIHYRIRGRNCQVRVIVEGYQLDVFNPLLFEGLTFALQRSGEFEWVVQAGDLKNHLGRRAHLEFIDLGDGWFEVDQIWFSNQHEAKAVPLHRRPEEGARTDQSHDFGDAEFAEQAAERIRESLLRLADSMEGGVCSQGDVFIAAWLFEHNFEELFGEGQATAALKYRERCLERVQQMKVLGESVAAPRYGLAMVTGSPEDGRILVRGNPKVEGNVVPRRDLTAFGIESLDGGVNDRLALARRWASGQNPLTARVIVNRIWHHLMGQGIVTSVDDFGVMGEPPSHPELLDYLAAEFIADGWSLKRMIRRIVLTNTYRLSSVAREREQLADPARIWLHARQVKRLEGEIVRDALLAVSGQLDREMFGDPVPVHLTDFMDGRGRPEISGPLDGGCRRSIYLSVRRNFLNPMFVAFDTPTPFNTVGRRNVSNVPAQALIMMNDPLVHWCATAWAERLVDNPESIEDRIERMFWEALGRAPTSEELAACRTFVWRSCEERQADLEHIMDLTGVWADLGHVIFNMKDFIYVR